MKPPALVLAALLLVLPLPLPLTAQQQDPVLALRAASASIEAASAALAAAEAQTQAGGDTAADTAQAQAQAQTEAQVQALSETIRGLEAGLASLRLALRASKAAEAAKRAEMLGNRAELGRLLATLITLQTPSAQLAVLHPEGAVATARAGSVLATITPALRAKAERLRADLATLAALDRLHQKALEDVQAALSTLQRARDSLTRAIQAARPAPAEAALAGRGLSQLAQAAQDLTTLAAALQSNLPATSRATPGQPARPGTLPLPVAGATIARPFNAPDGAGIRQPGILITAPALSLVTAPQAGIVRFSGGFLDYGLVVIIEPAPDQLQIFAGFGQVYVRAGDVLESGAALGLLGGEMPDSAEFLAENGGENDKGTESLYIEIRENGIPVDPQTWFTTN